MCESIKEGWRIWERSKFGDTWDNLQTGRSVPVSTQEDDDDYETIEVKETRYRKEKRCRRVGLFRTECYFVDVPYTATVKKRVKKKRIKPIPESPPIELKTEVTVLPTPIQPLRRLFAHLRKPTTVRTFVDAGSGDGSVLIEASRAGWRSIGVEIEKVNVDTSRAKIRESGFPAIVHHKNALEFDYSGADDVYIYQYPDLMRKIVRKLRPGTRIISYQHPIEGVKCTAFDAGNGSIFYIGIKGDLPKKESSAKKSGFTFGL